jgi:hypothetical protein
MTLHVRQSDRTRARPTLWTPWGAMPATREPSSSKAQADRAAARPHLPRLVAVEKTTRHSEAGGRN